MVHFRALVLNQMLKQVLERKQDSSKWMFGLNQVLGLLLAPTNFMTLRKGSGHSSLSAQA